LTATMTRPVAATHKTQRIDPLPSDERNQFGELDYVDWAMLTDGKAFGFLDFQHNHNAQQRGNFQRR